MGAEPIISVTIKPYYCDPMPLKGMSPYAIFRTSIWSYYRIHIPKCVTSDVSRLLHLALA